MRVLLQRYTLQYLVKPWRATVGIWSAKVNEQFALFIDIPDAILYSSWAPLQCLRPRLLLMPRRLKTCLWFTLNNPMALQKRKAGKA